jgi:hypothetical protein
LGRRGHRSRGGGDILMTAQTMASDTKERIRELEGQKVILEDRLEHLGYAGNLVKMHELENEVYEIEDTIRKLIGRT